MDIGILTHGSDPRPMRFHGFLTHDKQPFLLP